jgi:hypothetical protein
LTIGSDPRAGTAPSVLDHKEILTSVSLYYLTKSIVSSIYIYYQNPNGFKSAYTKAKTDAPMLFSAFKYNVGFWPPALVAQTGNLVFYNSMSLSSAAKGLHLTNPCVDHDFGGHFAGLDNPPALMADLREIGKYW